MKFLRGSYSSSAKTVSVIFQYITLKKSGNFSVGNNGTLLPNFFIQSSGKMVAIPPKMTAKNFIEANRNYPGNHNTQIIHAFEVGNKVLTMVWIEVGTGQKTFANWIFDIQGDRILSVEEYWAEPYATPENRKHWVELY